MKKYSELYSDKGKPKVRLSEEEYEIIYNYREKEKPKEKRILVIGDLIIDKYVFGDVLSFGWKI